MKNAQYKRYTRSRAGSAVYFLFLVLAGLFTVFPMLYMVVTSFKPLDELLIFPPRFFVVRPTMMNYMSLSAVLSNIKIPLSRYLFNSVFLTAVITFFQILFSTMAAFVISKMRLKGVGVFFLIVQFSLLYNGVTLAIPN